MTRRRMSCVLLCAAGILRLYAQPPEATYFMRIDSVVVTGARPLSESGVQKTVIDTFLLRENISGSLADLLSQGSSVFVKSYGRATLSTVSFRGTGPSHTQVFWNGLRLNSPMLGTVDFSTVPAPLVDRAAVYHGAASTAFSGGGLGGAVAVSSSIPGEPGLSVRYTQGIGSFGTFDEYAEAGWRGRKFGASMRFIHSASPNDYPFVNRDKLIIETDDDGIVTGRYNPTERNRNGSFRDLHALAEFTCDAGKAGRFDLSGWYFGSRRGIPSIKTDYGTDDDINRQDERTLRLSAGWNRPAGRIALSARAGYSYTDLRYFRSLNPDAPVPSVVADSRNCISGLSGSFRAAWYASEKLNAEGTLSVVHDRVHSRDMASLAPGGNVPSASSRTEYAAFLSVRWRPWERLTLSANLRQEFFDAAAAPFIPAGFLELLLSRKGNVVLKASAVRNFHAPTLNDLYYRPGGNTSLRGEKGRTFDAGIAFSVAGSRLEAAAELSAYDSRIRDWILWMPATQGFWTPVNIKMVHSYGAEIKADAAWRIARRTRLYLTGRGAYTRAVNHAEPFGEDDGSVGRQLVYIPVWTGAVTLRFVWRGWEAAWKWNYASERFGSSSNDRGRLYTVPGGSLNDLSLGVRLPFRRFSVSLRAEANNLLNREYVSVLSHPMPGRNYALGIELRFRSEK